jgi:hypothetical protein
MRVACRPNAAVTRVGASVVTAAGAAALVAVGAAEAADGESALPVAAMRPAASRGAMIRDRMRVERVVVEVDMGFLPTPVR